MADLAEIDGKTRRYAEARRALSDAVHVLDAEVQALKRRRLPHIRRKALRAAEARAELKAALADSPELFQKPRTLTLHGVKVGYAKAKGKIVVEDAARVVALVRKHFPERFDDLVKIEEKPVKAALNQLSTAELRKIGCTVTEAGDEVVIKPVDGDVDRLVDALLKEADGEVDAATGTDG